MQLALDKVLELCRAIELYRVILGSRKFNHILYLLIFIQYSSGSLIITVGHPIPLDYLYNSRVAVDHVKEVDDCGQSVKGNILREPLVPNSLLKGSYD